MVPICSSSTGLKRPNPGLERETTMNARASKENRASRLLGALFEWIGQLPATGVCHSRDHEEVAWCCDSDLIKTPQVATRPPWEALEGVSNTLPLEKGLTTTATTTLPNWLSWDGIVKASATTLPITVSYFRCTTDRSLHGQPYCCRACVLYTVSYFILCTHSTARATRSKQSHLRR